MKKWLKFFLPKILVSSAIFSNPLVSDSWLEFLHEKIVFFRASHELENDWQLCENWGGFCIRGSLESRVKMIFDRYFRFATSYLDDNF